MERIAILFSGQTRSWNDMPHLWESYERLEEKLYKTYPDLKTVDYYGHTWDDQPIPFNRKRFVQCSVTPQSEIDDWVKEDFFARAWIRPQHHEWQKLQKQLFDDPYKVLNRLLRNSRAAYGQIFSFFHCVRQINEKYDAYYKTRWDNRIDHPEFLVNHFVGAKNTGRASVIFDSKCYMIESQSAYAFPPTWNNEQVFRRGSNRNWFLNDIHFILNQNALEEYQLVGERLWDYLTQVVTQYARKDDSPSSHTLWHDVHPGSIRGYPRIDGDACRLESINREQMKEEADKWGI